MNTRENLLDDCYSCLLSFFFAENLVPNIFSELFFVLQLLTAKGTSFAEDRESDLGFMEQNTGQT